MVIGRYYSIWYVACARCGEARACNNNVGGQCCPVCGRVCDKNGGTEAWLSTLRLAPSPSPRPPSSPALRARKGELASGTTPWPPRPLPPEARKGELVSGTTPWPPSAATRGEEGGACLRHYPLAPRPLPPGARKGGTARKYVGTPSRNDCAGTVCSQ